MFLIFTIIIAKLECKIIKDEKTLFCESLKCDYIIKNKVCGIRREEKGYRLKLFENECQLLKYGCEVNRNFEYGVTDIEDCEKALSLNNYGEVNEDANRTNNCFDCLENTSDNKVCGIYNIGTGYKIRIFKTNCELLKYNCKNNVKFVVTDSFLCNDIIVDDKSTNNNGNDNNKINSPNVMNIDFYTRIKDHKTNKEDFKPYINGNNGENPDEVLKSNIKNLIIVDTPVFNVQDDFKENIDNFFVATHVFDLPLKEVDDEMNGARRMHLPIAGPVKVFKPWITIPKNISEDYYHRPTLSSCFHKCPTKCPETYSPVCGRPGIAAREPTLVFKNHCYMDYAQCKMRWENNSDTAISSNYIESSFIFCLGDELNGLYRFLPLIRTLQHMGRLKKKGHFRYKLKNMRFFNNILRREPKLMG